MKTERLTLEVHQVRFDDVFLDTVRVPKVSRGSLEAGHFYKVKTSGGKAYVVLRGSDLKNGTIRIDDAIRERLGVKEGEKCDFEFTKLNPVSRFLPLLFATNPFTRFVGWLTTIGFALTVISVIPLVIDFACWLRRLAQ